MKKITCDICHKDISKEFDTEYNEVESYDDNETLDLCNKCLDIYSNIRFECGKQYSNLKRKYDKQLEKEIKKFFKEKIKDVSNEKLL